MNLKTQDVNGHSSKKGLLEGGASSLGRKPPGSGAALVSPFRLLLLLISFVLRLILVALFVLRLLRLKWRTTEWVSVKVVVL